MMLYGYIKLRIVLFTIELKYVLIITIIKSIQID